MRTRAATATLAATLLASVLTAPGWVAMAGEPDGHPSRADVRAARDAADSKAGQVAAVQSTPARRPGPAPRLRDPRRAGRGGVQRRPVALPAGPPHGAGSRGRGPGGRRPAGRDARPVRRPGGLVVRARALPDRPHRDPRRRRDPVGGGPHVVVPERAERHGLRLRRLHGRLPAGRREQQPGDRGAGRRGRAARADPAGPRDRAGHPAPRRRRGAGDRGRARGPDRRARPPAGHQRRAGRGATGVAGGAGRARRRPRRPPRRRRPTPTATPTATPTPTKSADTDGRAHEDPHGQRDAHTDSHPDTHADPDAHPDADPHADGHPHRHPDARPVGRRTGRDRLRGGPDRRSLPVGRGRSGQVGLLGPDHAGVGGGRHLAAALLSRPVRRQHADHRGPAPAGRPAVLGLLELTVVDLPRRAVRRRWPDDPRPAHRRGRRPGVDRLLDRPNFFARP